MQFIPIPQVAQVEVRYLLFNQQMENTLYFQKVAANIAPGDLPDLAFAVLDYWQGNQLLLQSNQAQIREVYVTDLTSATSPAFTFTTGLPLVGGIAQAAAPGGTTLAISFRTLNRGRSARGRNYFIGVPQTVVSGNQLDNSYVNDVALAYSAMVGIDTLLSGWVWGVASRFTNNAPRTVGVFNACVAAIAVNNDIDSQRRRLAGRGE